MKGVILSSVGAAAHGAKLASVETVPHFPAPFSVEMAAHLSTHSDVFEVESNSAAITAAIGASAAGKRVFVPASSPLTYEAFYAPFMRLPFVIANVSRSQHGVKSDHSSVMSLRDSGYLMFFPESNQEIYDTVVHAYKVAEDPKVLLPAIINLDGLHNFTEPVQISSDAKGFLGKPQKRLDAKKPLSINQFADNYDELKFQQHKAMENALDIIAKTDEKWKQRYRRSYGLVEKYMTDDAEIIIVVMGYHAATAKAAVRKLRDAGKKVGVLRIRVFRPWPPQVEEALKNAKKVVVFDQSVSLGVGSILAAHIRRPVSSVIALGKYPSEKDFTDIIAKVEKSDNLKMWL